MPESLHLAVRVGRIVAVCGGAAPRGTSPPQSCGLAAPPGRRPTPACESWSRRHRRIAPGQPMPRGRVKPLAGPGAEDRERPGHAAGQSSGAGLRACPVRVDPGRRYRSRRHQPGPRPGRRSRGTPGARCRPATPLAVSGAAGSMPRPRASAPIHQPRLSLPASLASSESGQNPAGKPWESTSSVIRLTGSYFSGRKPCNECTCYGTVAAVTAVAVTRPSPCPAV